MPKQFILDFQVIFSCIIFWSCLYSTFILFLEAVSLSIFSGALLITVTTSSYLFLWYISLPQPDKKQVSDILGNDIKVMKRRNSLLTLNPIISGDEDQSIDNGDFFAVIGHRGAGLDAPENSLSAIKQCYEKGCRAVEFDLALTADGVPVLFHDSTVDRLTSSSGLVQHMTWNELRALDISEKHPLRERFVGEKIALFRDTIKLCLEHNLHMIIDVKDESSKIVQVILDTFKEHPEMYKMAMVSAFNPSIIYMVRSRDPLIVCSLAWRPYFYSCSSYGRDSGMVRRYSSLPAHLAARTADIVSTWLFNSVGHFVLGLSAVLLHKDGITSEVISEWEKKNIRVVAWTVNRPHEKLYFNRILQIAYITDTLVGDRLGTVH